MAWIHRSRAKQTADRPNTPSRRAPLIFALEPRLLFDGAVVATAVEAAAQVDGSHATTDAAHTDAPPPPAGRQVVFVDSRVQDADKLLQGVTPGTDIVKLQSNQDGLKQIADYLAQNSGASAAEIIAHGNAGDLWLGQTYLSADNAAAHAGVLAQIGNGLQSGGDILIYACNTAAGDRGIAFVTSLAQLTGRDVAASSNRTGIDGDWNLEVATGRIEAAPVLSASAEAAYTHDLATITVTSSGDSGAGTLRNAISSATAGDTITFSAGMTINLSTLASGNDLLLINKNLTIDGDLDNNGTPDVTLNGQYNGRVLEISSGTVTLDGLTVENGLVSGNGGGGGASSASSAGGAGNAALGAGILVSGGTVTINHCVITQNVAAGGGGGGTYEPSYAQDSYGGGGGGGFSGKGGGDGGKGYGTGYASFPAAAQAQSGGSGTGGRGAGYYGGGGGSTAAGGGGGVANPYGFTAGGAGGLATVGGFGSVGGGGGGASYYALAGSGGTGGAAAGGISVSAGATLYMANTTISKNLGAGGGGGAGSSASSGGTGGIGVGGIYVAGTLHYQSSTTTFTSNSGGGGTGGQGSSTGSSGASQSDIDNNGGTVDSSFTPPNNAPTLGTVTANAVGQANAGDTSYSFTVVYNDSDGTIDATTIDTSDVSVSKGATNLTVTNATWDASTHTATYTVTPPGGSWDDADNGTWTIGIVGSQVADNDGAFVAANTAAATYSVSMDTTAPSVGSVNVPADATYVAGQNLDFTVNFSEAVTVNTAGGTPFVGITLDTGGTVDASYLSGSGTSALTFRYTVASGNLDTDGVALAGAITANGATMRDAAGNDATLTLSGVASTAGVLVDAVAPSISSATVPANATYAAGQNLDFTVAYSEAVTVNTGGGTPFVALTLDTGGSVQAAYVSGSGTSTLTFRYTVAAGNADSDGIAAANSITLNGGTIKDAAGNDAATTGIGFASTASVLVDGVAPSVASINRVGSSLTNATSVDYTVTFSENVTGVDTFDFTLTGTGTVAGTVASVTPVNGSTYTVSVNGVSGDGTLRLDLKSSGTGITDTPGNAIGAGFTSGQTYSFDHTAPAVASVSVPADGTYIAGQNLDFTVNFDEAVVVDTSSGTPRIAITLDTGGTVNAAYLSGSGTSALTFRYTIAAGTADPDGVAVGGSIDANGGTLRDAAGNDATLTLNSVGSTAAVLVDAVAPTVASVTPPANATYAAGQNLDFTVNFSEAVTVNTAGGTPFVALTLDTGGTVDASYVSGSGTSALVFRYTVASGNLDTDGVVLAGAITSNGGTLRDSTGNDADTTLNAVGSTAAVLVDGVAPSVSSIDIAGASPTNAASVDYTVTFSENVTGVDASDFALTASGTAAGTVASVTPVNASTYTVTVNGAGGDGTLRLDLNNAGTGISDAPGNAIGGGFTGGQSYTLDHTAPTVASVNVPADGTYVTGQNLDFTANFSEAVTVNTAGGTPRIALTLDTGGTVFANYVSGSGTNAVTFRNTVVSGTADTNGIVVAASIDANGGTLRDAAGNDAALALNSVGSTANVNVDGSSLAATGPVATYMPAPAPLQVSPDPIDASLLRPSSASPIVLSAFAPPTPGSAGFLGTARVTPDSAPLVSAIAPAGFDGFAPAEGHVSIHAAGSAPVLPGGFISVQRSHTGDASIQVAGTGTTALTLGRGAPFALQLPPGTFTYFHGARDATLTIDVHLANGRALPSWLRFDAAAGRLDGHPPHGWNQPLEVVVVARDSAGHASALHVVLRFGREHAANDRGSDYPALNDAARVVQEAPLPPAHTQLAGKASLGEQFARHGHAAWARDRSALVNHAQRAAQQRAMSDRRG